MSYQRQRY